MKWYGLFKAFLEIRILPELTVYTATDVLELVQYETLHYNMGKFRRTYLCT